MHCTLHNCILGCGVGAALSVNWCKWMQNANECKSAAPAVPLSKYQSSPPIHPNARGYSWLHCKMQRTTVSCRRSISMHSNRASNAVQIIRLCGSIRSRRRALLMPWPKFNPPHWCTLSDPDLDYFALHRHRRPLPVAGRRNVQLLDTKPKSRISLQLTW